MLLEMPNYIHVVPVGDLQPHEERYMEGYECKCEPKIKLVYDSILVIHNSFDGREGVEWAEEVFKMPKCYKSGGICRFNCNGLCKESQ